MTIIHENTKDFTKADFEVRPFEKGLWYITMMSRNVLDKHHASLGLYLHKDGTVHDICGTQNMWSQEEAEAFLDSQFPPLPDDLFEII